MIYNTINNHNQVNTEQLISSHPSNLENKWHQMEHAYQQAVKGSMTSFILKKGSSLERITGGELAFAIDKGAKESFLHKLIAFGQNLIESLRCRNVDIYVSHVMIIIGKKDDSTLLIAEATGGRGLKETEVNINELKEHEEIRVYQDCDPAFRESLVKHTSLSIDRIPLEKDYANAADYQKALASYKKNNGLYNYALFFKMLGQKINWGPKSEKRVAYAATDFLLEQPILDKGGNRKTFTCSSFVALNFQATKLLHFIPHKKLNEIKQLKDRRQIAYALLHELREIKEYTHHFFKDRRFALDAKWVTPSELDLYAKKTILYLAYSAFA